MFYCFFTPIYYLFYINFIVLIIILWLSFLLGFFACFFTFYWCCWKKKKHIQTDTHKHIHKRTYFRNKILISISIVFEEKEEGTHKCVMILFCMLNWVTYHRRLLREIYYLRIITCNILHFVLSLLLLFFSFIVLRETSLRDVFDFAQRTVLYHRIQSVSSNNNNNNNNKKKKERERENKRKKCRWWCWCDASGGGCGESKVTTKQNSL